MCVFQNMSVHVLRQLRRSAVEAPPRAAGVTVREKAPRRAPRAGLAPAAAPRARTARCATPETEPRSLVRPQRHDTTQKQE